MLRVALWSRHVTVAAAVLSLLVSPLLACAAAPLAGQMTCPAAGPDTALRAPDCCTPHSVLRQQLTASKTEPVTTISAPAVVWLHPSVTTRIALRDVERPAASLPAGTGPPVDRASSVLLI